jgi:hypothetical protein
MPAPPVLLMRNSGAGLGLGISLGGLGGLGGFPPGSLAEDMFRRRDPHDRSAYVETIDDVSQHLSCYSC